jgi:4-carboxymuconolactone decarboxylase
MARVPSVTRDQLSPQDQAVYDRIAESRGGVRGPFPVLLHCPEIADHVAALGAQLRSKGLLSGADRELVIITRVREGAAYYAWAAHEALARGEGTRAEAIDVVRDGRPTDGLTPREAVIIDTVRALCREHRLTDELYARAEAELGRERLIELVTLAGYYGMVGFILNAFAVEQDSPTPRSR